jgi:hypothetical protein
VFERDLERFKGDLFKKEFISHLYEGLTLSEACAQLKVNPAALGLTRRDDIEFDADIRAAQAFRVDMMADKLENIKEYESDAIMAGVISKNIQWLASKRYRQIYGDKVDHNINVQVNIRAAMDAALARTIEHMPSNALIENDIATDNKSAAQAPLVIDAEEIDPLS